MKTLSDCEAAMREAAMALPPSDFGSHRAIQAAARVMFAEIERLCEALEVIAGGDGDADVIARQTLDHTEN